MDCSWKVPDGTRSQVRTVYWVVVYFFMEILINKVICILFLNRFLPESFEWKV